MTKLRVLDLFSGIGGFALGLDRTGGFETVAFCEIEPFCRRVLAKHWPSVRCYDDIRTLTSDTLRSDGIAVDVICGGFPCQDISLAGKGAGLAGERSGLWAEYARLIREIRPKFVIVENVAALLSRGLADVLGDLAALGYDAEWHCIPAAAVGAPHRRDRLWIVAYPGSEQHEGDSAPISRAIAAELFAAGMADAPCELQHGGGNAGTVRRSESSDRRGDVADANGHAGKPCGAGNGSEGERGRNACAGGIGAHDLANSDKSCEGQGRKQRSGQQLRPSCDTETHTGRRPASQWFFEPDVGRVAHGVPARVDRLRGLGNAVVPQIPEIIGRAILQAEGIGK